MTVSILYRGPLRSCNYGCGYCPFALVPPGAAELERDAAALDRFLSWVAAQSRPLAIFFTPWGEALTRAAYRDAVVRLSHLAHVNEVAVQTNGSVDFAWLREANLGRVALWLSFHPEQAGQAAFVAKCLELAARGVRFSVGVVGTREQIESARQLRVALPASIYLWINAYKDGGPDYYTAAEIEALTAIDPLFPFNLAPHPSAGRPCRTGASVVSVDGEGVVRRCHFVDQPLGNIHSDDLFALLAERPCPNPTCDCHIGYVHLPHLDLYERFGASVLARIPASVEE